MLMKCRHCGREYVFMPDGRRYETLPSVVKHYLEISRWVNDYKCPGDAPCKPRDPKGVEYLNFEVRYYPYV